MGLNTVDFGVYSKRGGCFPVLKLMTPVFSSHCLYIKYNKAYCIKEGRKYFI